jgi:hypothetical protein
MSRSYIQNLAQGGGQLIVDGKPYLLRAAELNNSSLSSRDFMRSVFSRMVDNNVNILLGAISWQQIEPEEGVFDFEELTGVIEDARTHGLRLILLWFGAYKNGMQSPHDLELTVQANRSTHPIGSRRMRIGFLAPDYSIRPMARHALQDRSVRSPREL